MDRRGTESEGVKRKEMEGAMFRCWKTMENHYNLTQKKRCCRTGTSSGEISTTSCPKKVGIMYVAW